MKRSKLYVAGAFLSLTLSCSTDSELTPTEFTDEITIDLQESSDFLSIEEINQLIDQSFYENKSFSWDRVADNVLWSASVHGGNMITIGYGDQNESFHETKTNRIDAIENSLIAIVQQEEGKTKSTLKVKRDAVLNVMDIEVSTLETIKSLRNAENVRYLEPNGYSFYKLTPEKGASAQRSAGCDTSGQTLSAEDYRTISPGATYPWNFNYHNIEAAWSQATGSGVTIGIIDTGLSPNQSLLGANFSDGASVKSRTVEKYGTYIDSSWWWSNNLDGPNDQCGHGTSMASAALAPRNNDGLPVGVAYDASLVMYRGTSDVVLDDYHERKGVSNALIALANRSDVKIISMSIGYPWGIGNVEDAIKYAYSKGKLIFAAGGTSTSLTSWYPVIFPASMSEAVAVTGITDYSGGYRKCDICHDGSEIEFTIVMERDGDNNRTTPVLSFNNGQSDYVGGSSVATATTAGIAALVWSKYPSWTRAQVLNRMRNSSDLYGNKSGNYGYGNIDARAAVQ